MNEITHHIDQLISLVKEKSKNSHQKKEHNKVLARLEEARLWAKEIDPSSIELAVAESQKEVDETFCSCPEGATDIDCVVHGNK